MTEPVFTPWLPNPGTGKCPIPKWVENYQVIISGTILDADYDASVWAWNFFGNQYTDITHYRYAIPASLAELARKREVWDTMKSPRTEIQGRNGWSKEDWEIARRDLGLGLRGSYRPGVTATYNVETGQETVHSDPVNHPIHYMLAPNMEAIDVIRSALTPEEYMGYLKGSILKYRLRAGRKGDATEDLAKSDWYRAEAMKREEW